MATFTDKFDRADGDLAAGGGWGTVNTNGDLSGIIEIKDEFATNTDATYRSAAHQATTTATGIPQEIAAWIDCSTEHASSYVEIGNGFNPGGGDLDTAPAGVFTRFSWLPDGQRKVAIYHQFRNASGPQLIRELELVQQGGVEVTQYEGALDRAGALETPQLLRMVVTDETSGLRVRVFLNQDGDENPVLDVKLREGWVDPNISNASDFGDWWFGFGPNGTAESLVVASFTAADYVAETISNQLRDDQPTLARLREKVRTRYFGPNDLRSDIELDDALNDEVNQMVNSCGDSCWFLRRSEELTITTDADGFYTFDLDVRRILKIRRGSDFGHVDWALHDLTTGGAIRIQINRMVDYLNDTYWVDYLARHRRMNRDDDVCPIPSEHEEMVIVGAAVRLAERSRNNSFLQSQLGRYAELRRNFMRDMNRYSDNEKRVFGPSFRSRYRVLYRNY